MKKRILAGLLAGVMMFSAVPASASTIDGRLYGVTNPTIQVDLPLSLNFAANPFGLEGTTGTLNVPAFGQLYENQFDIQNNSNVYVRVTLDLNTVLGPGVTLGNEEAAAGVVGTAATPGEANTDPSRTNKHGSFSVILPTAVEHATGANTVIDMTRAGSDNARRLNMHGTGGTLNQRVGFILAPAPAEGTTVAANRLASFGFAAALNPYAAWAPGDINVGGVFGITPITLAAAIGTGGNTDVDPATNSMVQLVENGHRRVAPADLGAAPAAITLGFGESVASGALFTRVTAYNAFIPNGRNIPGSSALTIPFIGAQEAGIERVLVAFGSDFLPAAEVTVSADGVVLSDAEGSFLRALRAMPAGSDPIVLTVFIDSEAGGWSDFTGYTLTIRY